MTRRDKEWYRHELAMRTARSLGSLSSCRRAAVGCVIASDKLQTIEAVGYNGPPSRSPTRCTGDPGACGCVHAEANAIAKLGASRGLTLYSTTAPCVHCAGMIVNSRKIARVISDVAYRDGRGVETLRGCGIEVSSYRGVVPWALVVGEKENGPTDEWSTWESRLARGAFLNPASEAKLLSIGVDLTRCRSANLLPPSPEVGEWDETAAIGEGEKIVAGVDVDLILVCGRRAWKAFGLCEVEFGETFETMRAKFVLLPHPSGLNRWWNDAKNVRLLRKKISEIVEISETRAKKGQRR